MIKNRITCAIKNIFTGEALMIIFIDACAGRAERDELMVKKYLDC